MGWRGQQRTVWTQGFFFCRLYVLPVPVLFGLVFWTLSYLCSYLLPTYMSVCTTYTVLMSVLHRHFQPITTIVSQISHESQILNKNRFSFVTFTFYRCSRFHLPQVFGVRAAFCISECLNCVGRSRTSRRICLSSPQGSLLPLAGLLTFH